MTGVSRRKIVRALRAPVPAAPEDLGRTIREQIPRDVFAARVPRPESGRRLHGATRWALAASVFVTIGAGYLAVRLFDDRAGVARQELGDFDRAGPEPELERDAGRLLASSAETESSRQTEPNRRGGASRLPESSARREVPKPTAKKAPPETESGAQPPARRVEAAVAPEPQLVAAVDGLGGAARPIGAAAVSRDQPLPTERPIESRSGQSPKSQNEINGERSLKIRELEVEKRLLEREMAVLPGATANLEERDEERKEKEERTPRTKWHTARQRELEADVVERRTDAGADRGAEASAGDGYLEVATDPISTLTVIDGGRPIDVALGDARSTAVAVPVEALLDAAGGERGASARGEIKVEGARSTTPGRIVLLLTAELQESDAGAASGSSTTIEVELDPAAARRYRLLASHAHSLAPGPRAAPPAVTAPPLYRVAALVEIELHRDPIPNDATLGRVSLRSGGTRAQSTARDGRALRAADLTGWNEARVELRLAVLGAELALLPPDASEALYAPIDRELDRLLDGAGLDETQARHAAELRALASRAAGRTLAPARRPPAPPPRDDG